MHVFNEKDGDGIDPFASLTDLSGTLYGTTFFGGPGQANGKGGTAFSITPQGVYSVIYDFSDTSGYAPEYPLTALGNILYGVTPVGGGGADRGTMFSLTPQGALTVLYHFDTASGDPSSGLTAVNGDFYGTTSGGGSANHGTVYRITTGGTHTIVYSLQGGGDGVYPSNGLINVAGTLYGSTVEGGTGNCDHGGPAYNGCGTIFSVTPQGVESVLYSFQKETGSFGPSSLTYLGGVFYGTTYGGGAAGCAGQGCGTVFSITPQGVFSTLHTFQGRSDGSQPSALLNVNNVLFGTTGSGGDGCTKKAGCGTVFKITP